MFDRIDIVAKQSPLVTGKAATTNNIYSFENVLETCNRFVC